MISLNASSLAILVLWFQQPPCHILLLGSGWRCLLVCSSCFTLSFLFAILLVPPRPLEIFMRWTNITLHFLGSPPSCKNFFYEKPILSLILKTLSLSSLFPLPALILHTSLSHLATGRPVYEDCHLHTMAWACSEALSASSHTVWKLLNSIFSCTKWGRSHLLPLNINKT